jgi:hypothetical protein
MKNIFILFIAVVIFSVINISCKKESFITSSDARLSLSTDNVKFDTVFTTVGSVTQSFKIFNDNDQKLLLSKVKLMGGSLSAFKININGVAATEQSDIELAANDSMYVFVTVNVNPTAANLPFVISDSILVSYNGNDLFVHLEAYGQNAHFLNNPVISSNTTWPNDLPYVIFGGMHVAASATLSIDSGCRIYSHANAPFIVDGTLLVNGKKGNEVLFAGDRLDEPYKYFPSGWPGFYFKSGSKNNVISFGVIRNAYQAIVVQDPSPNANPKLVIHQTIIDNAFDAGILSINSSVNIDNSLISNCGKNINITLGGNYTFTNCTIASYSNSFLLHKSPVLTATNFADQNGSILTADLDATFLNCIFWGDNGNIDDEVSINKQGTGLFNVTLDHCLYKALNDPSNTTFNASLKNIDPTFDSIDIDHKYYDFRINNALAPGIDQGGTTGFSKDLDNKNRNVGLPDLGCYEKQ